MRKYTPLNLPAVINFIKSKSMSQFSSSLLFYYEYITCYRRSLKYFCNDWLFCINDHYLILRTLSIKLFVPDQRAGWALKKWPPRNLRKTNQELKNLEATLSKLYTYYLYFYFDLISHLLKSLNLCTIYYKYQSIHN